MWRKFSLIAKRMLEHVPEVGLYVPVRIHVYKGRAGHYLYRV
jgi:uncharacterized protein (DUF302 family)